MSTGRDQRAPMERLTQILFVLSRSPAGTSSTERLLEHVSFGAGKPEDRRRQLSRDIGHLNRLGWQITSAGGEGEAGKYRLVAGDLRLRVEFSAAEQAELQRVARAAQLSALSGAEPATAAATSFVPRTEDVANLDAVHRGVAQRCLLGFTYRGTDRQVHPHRLFLRTGGWYLRAREADGDAVKSFRLDRMSNVRLQAPGTAEAAPTQEHLQIDPIAWRVDEQVVATVRTLPEHVPQVVAMLGLPADEPSTEPGGAVVLRIPVTNRSAFRGRLYELGERVHLDGPADLRDEIRAHLNAVLAGGR